jgi:hypothetical protein
MNNTAQIVYELLSAGFGRTSSSPSVEAISKAREDLKTKLPAYDELLERAAILEATNNHLELALEARDQELKSLNICLALLKLVPSDIFDSVIESARKINSSLFPSLNRFAKEKRTKEARESGAIKRTSKDKQFVKECWQKWQSEPSRYKSVSEFARDMASKELSIKCDRSTVAKWIKEWKQEKIL